MHAEEFQWADTIINRLNFQPAPQDFVPYYDPPQFALSPAYPEVYNKYGERMEIFFISDRVYASRPNKRDSRYIIWDRYNYGNKTHFYSHDEIFRTVGKPEIRFAMLMEPRSIKPQSYENVLKHKDYVEKNFALLFTHDAQVLNDVSNACFVPFYANVWYRKRLDGTADVADNYTRKTKNISMISSAKEMCDMHIVRKKLAFRCKAKGLADTFGTFDGGEFASVDKYLEQYRYSIAIENDLTPYFFTEKILNCFAAQTIPIYLGATKIDKFFNADGIIQIGLDDCNHIEDILKRCTPEEYERRLPAVIDNYNRAMRSMTHTRFDEMYVQYIRGK